MYLVILHIITKYPAVYGLSCLKRRAIESAVAKLHMQGSRAFQRLGPTDSKPRFRNKVVHAWSKLRRPRVVD